MGHSLFTKFMNRYVADRVYYEFGGCVLLYCIREENISKLIGQLCSACIESSYLELRLISL